MRTPGCGPESFACVTTPAASLDRLTLVYVSLVPLHLSLYPGNSARANPSVVEGEIRKDQVEQLHVTTAWVPLVDLDR